MISQDTADKITSWAQSRMAGNAPSLVYDNTPAVSNTGAQTTGLLDGTTVATATIPQSSAPAQTTAPAPTAAPASTSASWAQATSTPAASSSPISAAPSSTPTSAPTAVPAAAKPNYSSVLDGLYQSELGRSADAAGKSWWEGQMANGITADQVRTAMDNSDEYKALHPKPTAAPTAAPGPATINTANLTHRVIDAPTQTVQGQINSILSENSPVLQQARAQAMRAAADRGLLNSTMAASGGENAVIGAATSIGTTDAGFYNHAADYNAAADNQAIMYNADQQNQWQRMQAQLASDAAARAQQMSIAQMQDATSRFQAETSSATSRYNTDTNYRLQADAQKNQLVNNILQNMEMSPDRKAAMLEQLGMGTSAHTNADGSITPGTGLAGAAYVIDSTAADLRPNYGTTYDTLGQQVA